MLYMGTDDTSQWKCRSRGAVLRLWAELKRHQWAEHLGYCCAEESSDELGYPAEWDDVAETPVVAPCLARVRRALARSLHVYARARHVTKVRGVRRKALPEGPAWRSDVERRGRGPPVHAANEGPAGLATGLADG